MKKMVYAIMEYNYSGDDFEKNYTFDIDEARDSLKKEAEWGYNVNHKNQDKTRYVLNAYEVDTDEIDEDCDYDINDAKSLLSAYADSQCWLEPAFYEEYSDKNDDDVTAENLIDFVKQNDYARRITVMNYDEAVEYLNEINDANGCDESIDDFYGESVEENSIVFYSLTDNGDGRPFIYTPAPYQHMYIVAREAYEHAYGEQLDIPAKYCDDVTPVVPNPAPARDTTKRYYKDCDRAYIGDSDVASLTCTYFNGDKGVCADVISFDGDNSYYAYICKGDVELGDHYRKVLSGSTWIRLYDDKGLTYQHYESGYKFDIYRAGDFGAIIHWYKDGDQDDN